LYSNKKKSIQVVVRFPSHSTNLKYHHHPISIDNIDKNTASNFDTSSWSTLIDEAATEQNHYQNEEDDDDDRKSMKSEVSFSIVILMIFI